jgi:hypothetical protein
MAGQFIPNQLPERPRSATLISTTHIGSAMSASAFNISVFKQSGPAADQYERQLHRLIKERKAVDCIEKAVRDALVKLSGSGRKSFVIYGEPQSGKTEMMICLTAKLLDDGRSFILHLLNDSVDLLAQNLGRFQASGLAPSAQNFSDILVLGVIHKIHSPVRMCNTVPWLGGWGPWHNKCVWF